ncbi:hypothetical protein WICPIJ_007428 [Wickerhamomyces pijperi]|uniref:Uncharacterized protein n=1 Tax=Wickerhamomyces pijperi TaxID=599730 RepID=A0A9P8Q1V0_WICPI|nr:hypothetical protein WICPIJ_007428 [Wickerhamomyces pijperi]
MKAAPLAIDSSWFKWKDNGLPKASVMVSFKDGTLEPPPMTSTKSMSSLVKPACFKAASIGKWARANNGATDSSKASLVMEEEKSMSLMTDSTLNGAWVLADKTFLIFSAEVKILEKDFGLDLTSTLYLASNSSAKWLAMANGDFVRGVTNVNKGDGQRLVFWQVGLQDTVTNSSSGQVVDDSDWVQVGNLGGVSNGVTLSLGVPDWNGDDDIGDGGLGFLDNGGFQLVEKGFSASTSGWAKSKPTILLMLSTVFLMLEVCWDLPDSPMNLFLIPKPTKVGVDLLETSLTTTSIPLFLATATTELWLPKSIPNGVDILQLLIMWLFLEEKGLDQGKQWLCQVPGGRWALSLYISGYYFQ